MYTKDDDMVADQGQCPIAQVLRNSLSGHSPGLARDEILYAEGIIEGRKTNKPKEKKVPENKFRDLEWR